MKAEFFYQHEQKYHYASTKIGLKIHIYIE